MLVGAPDRVFDNPALKRAKIAITKRGQFTPRPKLFIQRPLLQRMVTELLAAPAMKVTVMWILTSYVFLLRHGQVLSGICAHLWCCMAGHPVSAFP